MDRNHEFFLTSHIDFLFIFGQRRDNCKENLFLKRKVGVTERPRSLNPSKTIAMAICPIIVHFSTWRTLSMHDVACIFACAAVGSNYVQKQLPRTSLNHVYLKLTYFTMNSLKSRNAGTLIIIFFIVCQASSTVHTRITGTWSLKDSIPEKQHNSQKE